MEGKLHELQRVINEVWASAISAPTADDFLRYMAKVARLEDEFEAAMEIAKVTQ